jgi:hypothetical protein
MEPGPQVGPRLELGELPVGPQPRLLHDVLRVGGAPRHPVSHAKQIPAVPFDERSERVGIAFPGPGDGRAVDFVHALVLGRNPRGLVSFRAAGRILPKASRSLPTACRRP